MNSPYINYKHKKKNSEAETEAKAKAFSLSSVLLMTFQCVFLMTSQMILINGYIFFFLF